jgi:hypothetical protein
LNSDPWIPEGKLKIRVSDFFDAGSGPTGMIASGSGTADANK